MSNSQSLAFDIAKTLSEHKASDVVVMDLRGLAGWTDFFVVASCTSSTQLRALGRHTEEKLEEAASPALNKPEAKEDQTWLLIDAGDLVVHIMTPEARKFYELEKLWFKAELKKVSVE